MKRQKEIFSKLMFVTRKDVRNSVGVPRRQNCKKKFFSTCQHVGNTVFLEGCEVYKPSRL